MGDITLRKALDDYRTVYMPYRNFADRTREEYLNDIEDFTHFLEQSGATFTRQLGLPIVERFAADLEHRGLASLTRKRKIVVVRSFLSYLYQDGYIETNISAKIILPFTDTTTPYILTEKECEQLRRVCAANARDAAIFEVLLQTGIRLSELTHLTLNDIDLGSGEGVGEKPRGFIRILGGRGRKERMVSLDFMGCIALRKYLKTRNEASEVMLFLNRFGEPLGERGVQKMISKYLKRAEIGRASVHTLRHTLALHYAAKGTKLTTLKDVMGFRDTRSASVYVSLAREVTNNELRGRIS